MEWNPDELAREFEATRRAGATLDPGTISVVRSPAPHRLPKELPPGRMAVVTFDRDGETLFVGKCGPNSGPRFTSQHYDPGSAPGTFAGSLLQDLDDYGLNAPSARADIRSWILSHTNRVDFLLPASVGRTTLADLEDFLFARLNPMYGASALHGYQNSRGTNAIIGQPVRDDHLRLAATHATKSMRVRALLDLGYSRGVIASALGISYQHVHDVVHASPPSETGSDRPARVARVDAVKKKHLAATKSLKTKAEKIRALRAHGYSRNAVANAIGSSYQYVYAVERTPEPAIRGDDVSRSGNTTRDVSRRHLERIARLPTKAKKIRFLLDKGYSLTAVARAAGASYVYVSGFSRPGADREPSFTGSGSVAKRTVTSQHQRMIAKLPSKAAKIRSLLSKGYGRKAIANAVDTSYQHVYLVEHSGTPT